MQLKLIMWDKNDKKEAEKEKQEAVIRIMMCPCHLNKSNNTHYIDTQAEHHQPHQSQIDNSKNIYMWRPLYGPHILYTGKQS